MSTSPPSSEDLTSESNPLAGASDPKVARRARRLARIIYGIVRLCYPSFRVEFENRQGLHPPAGAIYVTWHGRTLIPAVVMSHRGCWALISLSRDGEIQNNFFRMLGYQTARGSTGRGGVRGALQLAKRVKEGGLLVMTPDGPRGPTHKVQLGVILMAEKSGAPIVPVGISASRRWLMKSWDSYMVPKPFARVPFVVGEPIAIPPKLDEAGRQHYADIVELAINRLEREAERRAGHSNEPYNWPTEPDTAQPLGDTS